MMTEKELRERLAEQTEQANEQAGEAAKYLIMQQYSSAATCAHRAYQAQIRAQVYEQMLNA